ncbi:MAG: alpha/beta hydrolase [Flavipsychrobacter sp.]
MAKLITILSILILSAVQLYGQAERSNNGVISIGVKDQVYSRLLSENRELNIYLPDSYNPSDTVAYPVIYLLDGGTDEDFIHVVGLVQFNTFPWVNRLPKSIVVGIVNKDRKHDFTFPTTVKADKEKFPTTGGSKTFISFLEKELQPYIKAHYKTNDNRTIIGESLGGLLATEILFEKPNMFNKYIIISPSLWWDNGSILKRKMSISATSPANRTRIYIGVGKEGLAPTEESHVMEVDANVLADKIKALNNGNISLYFDYLPEETHATIAHQALLNAFKILGQ